MILFVMVSFRIISIIYEKNKNTFEICLNIHRSLFRAAIRLQKYKLFLPTIGLASSTNRFPTISFDYVCLCLSALMIPEDCDGKSTFRDL